MAPRSSVPVAMACAIVMLGMSSTQAALLLRYTFDEASSGTTAALDSGTGLPANGTFNNVATRTSDTPGGVSLAAMDTNGGAGTDYVSSASPAKLQTLGAFTLTAWVNLQSNPAQFDRIMSMHGDAVTSTTAGGFDWFFPTVSGSSFSMRLGVDVGAGGTEVTSFDGVSTLSLNPGLDSWVFLAVTYDGSVGTNNVNFYWGDEATAVAQLGVTRSLNAGTTAATTGDFRVGGTMRSTSNRTPDAFYDDVRVYSDVLSSSELDSVRLQNITVIPTPTASVLGVMGLALLLGRRRSGR